MENTYSAIENLSRHKAQLHDTVRLGSGIQLAAWSNSQDTVTQHCNHHILSLYTADGYETYRKTRSGWLNGGGPDRFCLMPQDSESTWDVRNKLGFVHLYCTDQHLQNIAEQIWDRNPATLRLDEQTFADDARITLLYRHFLLGCDWQQQANALQLSTTCTLLLTHLVQHYSSIRWRLPTVSGGLAPVTLRRVCDYIEQALATPLTLAELASEANLSEFHFARMFRQSMKLAPHQYVMQRRMARAEALVRHASMSLTEVALSCGFSSASHFSNRFKASLGMTPSQLRAASRHGR
jgi:AraC family transcriptional regulator